MIIAKEEDVKPKNIDIKTIVLLKKEESILKLGNIKGIIGNKNIPLAIFIFILFQLFAWIVKKRYHLHKIHDRFLLKEDALFLKIGQL